MELLLRPGDPVILDLSGSGYRVAARVVRLREVFPGEWRIWSRIYAVPISGPVVKLYGHWRIPKGLLGLVVCSYVQELLDGHSELGGLGRVN